MKQITAIAMALALLIISSPAAYSQAERTTQNPPPVAPTLVREGDFATSLASALDMATTENETEAETLLASAGIAPKNGWISDYPVTPDILDELRDTVAAAADSYRLPMGKTEALEILDSVSADLGLSVLSHDYEETPPSSAAGSQYTEQTVINNYYYREGPPVVTYYPPPPDYLYLYAWVPYPFWCNSFFFSGYFILHDFHKVVCIRNRIVVVSNHFYHRHPRRFYRIDPVRRRGVRPLRGVAKSFQKKSLFTAEAHRGARSILQRSHERLASLRRVVNRNGPTAKLPRGFKGWSRTETSRQQRPSTASTGGRVRTFPRQNIQKGLKNSARFFRNTSISNKSSSSLTSVGGRGFSGSLGNNRNSFSGKFSRNFSGGSPPKSTLRASF